MDVQDSTSLKALSSQANSHSAESQAVADPVLDSIETDPQTSPSDETRNDSLTHSVEQNNNNDGEGDTAEEKEGSILTEVKQQNLQAVEDVGELKSKIGQLFPKHEDYDPQQTLVAGEIDHKEHNNSDTPTNMADSNDIVPETTMESSADSNTAAHFNLLKLQPINFKESVDDETEPEVPFIEDSDGEISSDLEQQNGQKKAPEIGAHRKTTTAQKTKADSEIETKLKTQAQEIATSSHDTTKTSADKVTKSSNKATARSAAHVVAPPNKNRPKWSTDFVKPVTTPVKQGTKTEVENGDPISGQKDRRWKSLIEIQQKSSPPQTYVVSQTVKTTTPRPTKASLLRQATMDKMGSRT